MEYKKKSTKTCVFTAAERQTDRQTHREETETDRKTETATERSRNFHLYFRH